MVIDAEKEFIQLSENIRHWERLRWMSMTVFIAIMFGTLTALFNWDEDLSNTHQLFFKIVGFILVVVFWVQDERIVSYWLSFRERAKEVEKENNIKVFTVTPKRGLISAGTAVRILYVTFAVVWLLLIVDI
jgi:hypothetical protein